MHVASERSVGITGRENVCIFSEEVKSSCNPSFGHHARYSCCLMLIILPGQVINRLIIRRSYKQVLHLFMQVDQFLCIHNRFFAKQDTQCLK